MAAAADTFRLVVQTSTVELFDAFGVPVAPASGVMVSDDGRLGGLVDWTGSDADGRLSLSLNTATIALTLRHVQGQRYSDADWIRELANQLAGRIKNRLLRFDIRVQIGLPFNSGIARFARAAPQSAEQGLTCAFRSLRGDIVVNVTGRILARKLAYSSGEDALSEGEVVLF